MDRCRYEDAACHDKLRAEYLHMLLPRYHNVNGNKELCKKMYN